MTMIQSTTSVDRLPSHEELEFYVRKGRRERSEAFHALFGALFAAVSKAMTSPRDEADTTAKAPKSVRVPLGRVATAG